MNAEEFETARALLPWSNEAESSVLGALLMDNDAWDAVGDMLKAEQFYDAGHRLIFGALANLLNASKPADIITVFHALESDGTVEQIGGLSYLNKLAQYVPSAANTKRYAQIVVERAMMRGLTAGGEKIKELATQAGLSLPERLDQAQGVLQSLQLGTGRVMPTAIASAAVAVQTRMNESAAGNIPPGIPTRFPGLDRMFGGGLKGGKQVIIAARPSIGKSSFAEQLCLNLAENGVGTGFFSQEMSKEELTERALANLADVPLDNIILGKLSQQEWSRVTHAVGVMEKLPMYFDDQSGLTLHDITAKARMLVRQHGVKAIVVDYIQLCDGGKDDDSRHHQIEQLSRGTKKLARQLGITVILLSQLNRAVEQRASGRPVLSDLKESGAIEEDADIVMLLSRAQPSEGAQIIHCDVPKNRQGKIGAVSLVFNGEYQKWQESAVPFEFKTPARKHYTEDV
jgi:replicative DNA helicase